MVLEIALGIILAFFIMGLLEDYPQIVNFIWIVIGIGVVWLLWPHIWGLLLFIAAVYGINYLFTYIESRKKK